jgi:hypothetical protein
MDVTTVRRSLAAAVAVTAALSGCSAVHAVKAANHVRHNVVADKATMDAFAATLKSGAATPFAATYVTSGHSPATVRYAVRPPDQLAFSNSPSGTHSGGIGVHLVANSSGEYSCSQPSAGGAAPTCQKLGKASAASRNQILGIYTPAHWVNFLKGLSLAAGLAGDRVTSSQRSIHGFPMSCVDFHATTGAGKSTICTTAQGILGYVRVASDPTSFAITAYSTSPPASLFELPPGARVTTSQ